jgi:biotin transport system substrate-specific component
MAATTGWLAAKGYARTLVGALGVALVAEVVLYAFGVAWLGTLIGFDKAIAGGVVPFLLSDAVKAGLAASLMVASGRLAR